MDVWIASVLFVLQLGLVGGAAILPVLAGYCGYRGKPKAPLALGAIVAITAGMAALLFQALDNTQELRDAFGSETHEGIAIGVTLAIVALALPSLVLSVAVYFGARWFRLRQEGKLEQ